MERTDPVHIVGISGSLRRSSSNSALVTAAAALAPDGIELSVFCGLSDLPPFNPDLEGDAMGEPGAVADFRRTLRASDAVLISSPEYAHGVPGAMKNALDWIVGSGELVGKPVAVINASARAIHAWASLVETLTVMSARVVLAASITIPLQGMMLDAAGIVANPGLAASLAGAVAALASAAREGKERLHLSTTRPVILG